MKKLLLIIITLLATINLVVAQDTEPDYLCFEVESGTVIKWTRAGAGYKSVNVEYSYDKHNWQEFKLTTKITVENTCLIYFRGENTAFYEYGSEVHSSHFSVSKPFKCSGNIMTLLDKTGKKKSVEQYAFALLFKDCPLITAPKLPATQLAKACYSEMFRGCKELIVAPELPAKILKEGCYNGMFRECTKLTTSPFLPAEVLVKSCYWYMFSECNNLNYISVGFKSWNGIVDPSSWVSQVASIGTFVCPKELSLEYNDSRIPKGWNVKYIEDLYSITISESSKPYITISKITGLDAGDEVSFSITDRTTEGYTATVTVQGSEIIKTTQSGNDYTFTMPSEDVSISVDYNLTGTVQKPDYLCFEVEAGTEISFNPGPNGYVDIDLEYSLNQIDWVRFETNNSIIVPSDCKVYFRGNNHYFYATDAYNPPRIIKMTTFNVTKPFKCSGNIMTIIDRTGESTFVEEGAFVGLFSNTPIITPPELPAMELGQFAYMNMFSNCTQLISAPELPANKITDKCYEGMFSGCTSIKQAPKIIIANTEIGHTPYREMFSGCTQLEYISVDFIEWPYDSYLHKYTTTDWVKNVAPMGTFVCPKDLELKYGDSFIPTDWQVKYVGNFFNISINDLSVSYITISQTTNIEVGTKVSFSVSDRTTEGYTATVAVQGTEPIEPTQSGNDYTFTMPAEDVTISVTYSSTPINYTITTDEYVIADKTEASEGETVNVTFKNRVGYNLTSATYNGTPLNITNGTAQFTMPAANVTIATTHTLIEYKITTGEFVTVNKTKATINDQVSFTVEDRTNDGYKLDKVLVNNTDFSGTSFNMADYLKDVTITAQYSKIGYTITTDAYSSTNKTTANVGDEVTVTFKNRGGYNLTSATYNGTPLNITNGAAQFTMPAANVTIATTHTPIEYNITAGEFVTVDKTKATINDQVSFTVADRTSNGYKLDKVLVNNAEFSGTSFNMADYLKDVTITAQYSKIAYTITTDAYSSTDKTAANAGDVVTVTFKNRGGYNLTSATYNGTPLNITNGAAQFTMPAANVTIATSYTTIEYNITAGEFITVDKTKATINDKVSFTVADRSSEGLLLEKVLVNNAVFSGFTIDMKNYLQNVEIKAVYAHNSYTITNDEYTTTDKASANEGDVVNVTFTNRVGYNLTSATYNGTPLNITNGTAQFTMPAANVTIATTHTLIEYKITTGEFVTVNKTKATINDQVSFTVEDRTNDGYKLDKVLVNNTDFSGTSFNMADYLTDVTITAVYSKNSNPVVEYNITNDEFSTTDKSSANEGVVITVTFTNRDGYNLTSATYNGTPLNITNNAAQFTMPAANVTIATTYKPIKNDKLLIVDDIIVEADGYCAGDVLRLSFKTTCKKGKYQIMFSGRAKTEGFVDLDFADIEVSERQTAKFDIPSSTNYGNYQGFIRVVDVDGNEGAAFPFGFNIDYPNDIIETKYADLICVNNFSHNYVAYQWMKNGKEIAGANKQFYIDYPALNGVYNVIVTDKNGNKFKVCDFRAAELKTKSAPKPSVNVYPNPAQSMQPITIELVGVDITEKCEIMLYTHSGSLVQKIADAKSLNVVYLKSGIYTGVVVINGKKLTFKLIVND